MEDEEKFIDSKNRFENLVGNRFLQNLVISEEDQVLKLMDAIPEKHDPLKDTYYNNTLLDSGVPSGVRNICNLNKCLASVVSE